MVMKVESPTKAGSGKDKGRQVVFREHDDSNNEEAGLWAGLLREVVASIRAFIQSNPS